MPIASLTSQKKENCHGLVILYPSFVEIISECKIVVSKGLKQRKNLKNIHI